MGKPGTEEIIIDAAAEEFIENGFDGSRMRHISDRAGINKGLLHYYFKTKDVLFGKVFAHIFGKLMERINDSLSGDDHLFDKIRSFTYTYVSTVHANPQIPRFVMNEMSKNPDRLLSEVMKMNKQRSMTSWIESVNKARRDGDIIEITPEQLFCNMISQCIFPFLGRPMLQYMMGLDNEGFNQFVEERKTLVAETVIRSIQIQKT